MAPGLAAVARLSVSPCKCSCCIPMFLFCGAAVAPQSHCLRFPCKRSFMRAVSFKQDCISFKIALYFWSWSTLVQIMAWCHLAPSHYLDQCWLIISNLTEKAFQFVFSGDGPDTKHNNVFENSVYAAVLFFFFKQPICFQTCNDGIGPSIILCMCPVNERQHYNTTSLIGWTHTQNDHCCTQIFDHWYIFPLWFMKIL